MTGTDLAGVTAVTFGGGPRATIVSVTATSLTVTVPSGSSSGNVLVTSPDGTSQGIAFTVLEPPAPPPAQTFPAITSSVELPPSTLLQLSDLNVSTLVASTGTKDGSFTIEVAGSGRNLVVVTDSSNGNLALMGFFDPFAPQPVTKYSTAVALLFYGAQGPLLSAGDQAILLDFLVNQPATTTLGKAIASGMTSFRTPIADDPVTQKASTTPCG